MNRKPLIGLNAEFRSAKKDSPALSYLAAGYYDAISNVGGIPVEIGRASCRERVYSSV